MSQLKVPITQLDHMRGDRRAPVGLVEYGDYQCPFCAAAQPVLMDIERRFGKNLLFVFRHFPLVEIHPVAGSAAESAEFAAAHERFWQMHQALYANQQQLSVPMLIALATQLKLSAVQLRDALVEHTYIDKIQRDFIGGVRSGVNGTPTFFVNGVRHDSLYGAATLAEAIDAALHPAAA